MAENKLYNEEQKERYLNFVSDNEGTKNTIRSLFYKSWVLEDNRERDLCNFNLEELGKVIKRTNPFSLNVAMSTTRFYSSYISWAITNGLRDNNINPLDGAGAEWVKDFVDNTKKIHYSHTEFLSLLDEMKNGQDQSFLFMIYEGIMGERFSELRELTFSDIDFINKKVFVRERNESVSISDECIHYLKKTREEDTYEQYNAKNNQYTTKKLLASDYIFKNIESPRGKENEPVKMNVIYNRLHSLKEIFNLEYLTPNAIKQSGMIHMAVELFKRDNVVAYDQFAEIGKKYNFSQITNNNHTYYNSYLMRNFITEDNVKNLYGMDIIIEKR